LTILWTQIEAQQVSEAQEFKMNIIDLSKEWIVNRIKERTTWDGVVLVAAGVTYLVFKPIASIVAYAAIAYGVWTIIKQERK
jgi:hypothetical protein